MKKLFVLFALAFSFCTLYGQDYHKIDSLKQILMTLPELDGTDADTARMKVCLDIGSLFEKFNPDSAIMWYSSAADTIYNENSIKKYIKRAKINATAIRSIGLVAKSQLDFPKATIYYKISLRISEEIKETTFISICLGNLGMISAIQGDFTKAIEYYERSLKIAEEINDKRIITSLVNNLGVVLSRQGNYTKAIEYYERSLKISEDLKKENDVAKSLNNIGITSMVLNDDQKSMTCYEKALSIAERIEDKVIISSCLNNIGMLFEKQNNYAAAKEYYEKALTIAEEVGDKQATSNGLANLGDILSYQKDYLKAIEYYERSIKICEDLGLKDKLAPFYPRVARYYIQINKPDIAMFLLLRSQDITFYLLKDNFSILSEKEKEDYLNKTKRIFNDLHSFNINFPGLNDSLSGICYNNELILKGLLLKSTSAVLNTVYNSPDQEVKKTYFLLKQLRSRISEMQRTDIQDKEQKIKDLENIANEQERKLVKLSSEFAGIQKLFEYKWEDVQKNLKTGEAAIEFVSFTQGMKNDSTAYAALLITPESKQPQTIKLFEEDQLRVIVGANSETGYGFINSLYGTRTDINESLYRIIWQPLEQYLAGINTIYYAPVGVLNKVSFAALGNENGQFLCDKYNLIQLSTTGKLINPDEKSEMKMTASVFGGIDYNSDSTKIVPDSYQGWKYLPGTLIEKESIEKQLEKNKFDCITYSGKEAKEENFKALFDSTDAPSILHVSTHGFFYPDPEVTRAREKSKNEEKGITFRGSDGFGLWMFVQNKNPMMRSGLVFAGANKVWSEDWGRTDNEGVLTAYEVSNMNMRNTDLVVLSACETGLGDIKGSEGVYGLQRAFKMAGVKYIIMSLWQVPDKETVEFMETFYKKLLKTKDVRSSFNETQNEMRKKYDPYYWAAFVIIE